MNRYLKILIALIVTGFIIKSIFWLVNDEPFLAPTIDVDTINFEKLDENVYIRAMSWGISGNHNEVIIASEPIFPIDRKSEDSSDYILYTTEIYYKKQGRDTLCIYTEASSISKETKVLIGNVEIVINELKTYDEFIDFRKNYKQYGLTRLSIYDD